MFFRNVSRMPDFGKSIRHPTNTPKRFKAIDNMITKMHQRWWAFKVLSQYPRESWPEMHLKITALELLRGKRAQWGIERRWKGDYLNDTSKNPMVELYRAALTKAGINQKSVIFSAEVKKFNRHNKMEERGLVITKDYILKLELGKKIKVAVNLPLASITKLSISPEARNQVLVMSFNAKGQNDFVMSFVDNEDLIGELIGTLSSIYQKKMGRNLEIYTSNILTAQTGKNYKTISVSGPSGPNSTFFANKDGTITYSG